MSLNDTMPRACSRCCKTQPAEAFYRKVANPNGRRDTICKECRRVDRVARQKTLNPTIPATKRCPSCMETKPADAFGKHRWSYDGLYFRCKECCKPIAKARYDRDGDKMRAAIAAYRLAQYNLTPESYAQLLAEQGGACAICRKMPNKRALNIDHDHDTGKVRGLLCVSCNRGIGLLRDNPDVVRAALAYLEKER